MKTILNLLNRQISILPHLMLVIVVSLFLGACAEDKLNEDSIFDVTPPERSAFDTWLLENYTYPYNIDFKYKMEDIESSMEYTLTPAEEKKSIALAKLIKFLWIDAYNEVAGIDFTRMYVPRVIHLVGSAAYENNGTMILGTAEGGLKITLYLVNSIDIENINMDMLNYYFFKTMHHEFAHILHQTKNFDTYFQKISEADYVSGDWYQISESSANQLGFVSAYAMSEPSEDFVENIAIYVTSTADEWANLLATAGAAGSSIILEKFEIVRNYLQESWGIDIDQLRDVVQRRTSEIHLLDLHNI